MSFRRVLSLLLVLLLTVSVLPAATAFADEILYSIGVDLTNQIVTVYAKDTGEIIRQSICSSGAKSSPTVTGTFSMPAKRKAAERSEWYHFSIGGYAHYATRIYEGYMFHSYLYNRTNESTVQKKTVAYLGVPVSHGCMRMYPEDAKWIALNCPAGTKVKIYYSNNRDEYLRKILKLKTFSVDDGVPYSEFVGGASHDGELGYGSTGEAVKQLQYRMLGLGLYTGAADGIYGADMVDTISTLQEAFGLEVNGKVTRGLWNLIFSDDAPSSDLGTVQIGSVGPMVNYVQALLKKASLYNGEINGNFDATTDAAVRKYQNYLDETPDGILTDDQLASLITLIDELQYRFPDGWALKAWTETVRKASIETKIRLNIREEPTTESRSLGQLVPKSIVNVLESGEEWTKIEFEGTTGYVMSMYIEEYDEQLPIYDFTDDPNPELVEFEVDGYVSAPLITSKEVPIGTGTKNDNMIFYVEKNSKSMVAFGLLKNSSIEIEEVSDGWARASYCGITGYIPTKELKLSYERVLSTDIGEDDITVVARNNGMSDIYVYDNVSVNSQVVGTLSPGQELPVIIEGDTWSQISLGADVGYVQNSDVSIYTTSPTKQEYLASVAAYLSDSGDIEGVTLSTANKELARAIREDEVIPETNMTTEAEDALDDYTPWDDIEDPEDFTESLSSAAESVDSWYTSDRDLTQYQYTQEDIDTSAAREAFDEADAGSGSFE